MNNFFALNFLVLTVLITTHLSSLEYHRTEQPVHYWDKNGESREMSWDEAYGNRDSDREIDRNRD